MKSRYKYGINTVLSETLSLNQSTVEKMTAELKNAGIIKRVGSKKTGYWEIVEIAKKRNAGTCSISC